MANALVSEGAEVVLNVPSLTSRRASCMDPRIKVPIASGKALAETLIAAQSGEGLVHFVLQLGECVKADLPQGTITSTREIRFIATFDSLNLMLYSDPNFDDYCRDHVNEAANGTRIGGFHLVPTLDLKPVMYEKAEQIMPWKEANPEVYINSEMGSF